MYMIVNVFVSLYFLHHFYCTCIVIFKKNDNTIHFQACCGMWPHNIRVRAELPEGLSAQG